MRRFLIFVSLVTITFLPATAWSFEIGLGPEAPLSPPSASQAPYEQHLSGVASNGRDFLAVWLDRRSSVASLPYHYGAVPLYVSKLDPAGRPLNRFGFRLRDSAETAALVWTANGYMVFWSENAETHSMLLDDDGTPLNAPKRVADGYVSGAASNARTILLLHGGYAKPGFASLFSLDGTLLTRTALDDTMAYQPSFRPFVIPNGSYGFVTQRWFRPGEVTAMLTTVSGSGAVSAIPLQGVSGQSQSAAAIGNGRLLLAWMSDEEPSGPPRVVRFRMFDLAGNPLTAPAIIASTNDIGATSGAYAPSVGWDGQQFLIAWQWPVAREQAGDIRAVRVTTDGVVIDSDPTILGTTLGSPPSFASNGTTQLIAWDTLRSQSSDIALRTATSFATIGSAPTRIIPESAALQTEVQLATLGANTLAVWREDDTNPAIVASFLNKPPVVVSGAGTFDQQAPAVAASRDQFLVVWREQSSAPNSQQTFRLLGKRLSSDGSVLDRDSIVIADDPTLTWAPESTTLAIGSDGKDFLVVWSAQYTSLRATRVSSSGAVIDAKSMDLPRRGIPVSARVVWNGTHYVVAWTADLTCRQCNASPIIPVSQIFVARIASSGDLVDSKMVWEGGYGSRIALASGARELMLTWTVSYDWVSRQACINSMPLHRDGSPSASASPVVCMPASGWPPQLPDLDMAWDGASYVVGWTVAGLTADAMAIHVSSLGFPIEPAPFTLASGPSTFQPALAPSPTGVVAAYSRIAMEPQYGGVARVFTRTLLRMTAPLRRRATH